MKKILLLLLFVSIFFSSVGCQFVTDRLLNWESLYGGGHIKGGEDVNIKKPDEARIPYVENFIPFDSSKLLIHRPAMPMYLDGYSYTVYLPDLTSVREISQNVVFDSEDAYSLLQGITTFRGSNYRNTSSYGFPEIQEKKLSLIWEYGIGNIDSWSGVGWTGQPAIVKWSPEVQRIMNMHPMYRDSNATVEVIYGALDGKVHFLDLHSGKTTRPHIDIRFPIKGSVTIDPRGYPLLYFGQGYNQNGRTFGKMGYYIYSLIDNTQLFFLDGIDSRASRNWAAFDSSAIIDRHTDTMIQGGENGLLYSMKLNTSFDITSQSITVDPDITRFHYVQPFGNTLGIENSPAVFKNFVYFTDNGGLMHCVDLNTMKPVWVYDVLDDADSSIVLDVIDETNVYLYSGTELELKREDGFSFIRKFNALTGQLIWENKVRCYFNPGINGGVLATPVVGKFSIDHLVIFTIARTGAGTESGQLIAYDKNSGDMVWSHSMSSYSWSSPATIYDKDGNAYLIQCDTGSRMTLLDGLTGEVLDVLDTGGIIEGTPAVYNNMIVVGTRSQKIIGVKIQ
ncbi:MAG: PQQ-binding-like beta-propeller repeat protein [Clostridia bacterium]